MNRLYSLWMYNITMYIYTYVANEAEKKNKTNVKSCDNAY